MTQSGHRAHRNPAVQRFLAHAACYGLGSSMDADADRIQALAKELVGLQPDVLVAHSTPSAKGLLQATRSIPIVFLTVTDPLGQGWSQVCRIRAETSPASPSSSFHSAPNGSKSSSRSRPALHASLPFLTPKPRLITGCICGQSKPPRAPLELN